MPKRIGVILLGYLSIAAPPLAPTPHPRIFLQLGHFVGCQQNTMFREKGFFSHEHLLKPIISSTNDHLCIAKLLSHPFWWLKLSSLILSSKQTDFVGCNSYIIFQTLILIYRVFFLLVPPKKFLVWNRFPTIVKKRLSTLVPPNTLRMAKFHKGLQIIYF